jgi:hypothetical protein
MPTGATWARPWRILVTDAANPHSLHRLHQGPNYGHYCISAGGAGGAGWEPASRESRSE